MSGERRMAPRHPRVTFPPQTWRRSSGRRHFVCPRCLRARADYVGRTIVATAAPMPVLFHVLVDLRADGAWVPAKANGGISECIVDLCARSAGQRNVAIGREGCAAIPKSVALACVAAVHKLPVCSMP